jgi:hypothetical protein
MLFSPSRLAGADLHDEALIRRQKIGTVAFQKYRGSPKKSPIYRWIFLDKPSFFWGIFM